MQNYIIFSITAKDRLRDLLVLRRLAAAWLCGLAVFNGAGECAREVGEEIMVKGDADAVQQVGVNGVPFENVIDIRAIAIQQLGKAVCCIPLGLSVENFLDAPTYMNHLFMSAGGWSRSFSADRFDACN